MYTELSDFVLKFGNEMLEIIEDMQMCSVPGWAAEHAADRKCDNYFTLSAMSASNYFVAVAIETLGLINSEGREFLLAQGRRGDAASVDPKEIPRLSNCTDVSLRGTFTPHTGDEDRWSHAPNYIAYLLFTFLKL